MSSPSHKSKLKELNDKWFPDLNNASQLLSVDDEAASLLDASNSSKSFELI